jgi:hypothetical protein
VELDGLAGGDGALRVTDQVDLTGPRPRQHLSDSTGQGPSGAVDVCFALIDEYEYARIVAVLPEATGEELICSFRGECPGNDDYRIANGC